MLFLMNKQIVLDGRTIKYTLVASKRTRKIRVAVYPGGEIKVTAPASLPMTLLEQFLVKKAKWIVTKHNHLKQFPVQIKGGNRAEYQANKAKALALATERLNYFNQHYGFTYNRISIKNHRSLWGSCSKRGNLNFNYKIALLRPEAADYIIVHELCHLKEFNHSARFWALVAQSVPNYKQIRLELKKFGLNMA